MGPEGYSRNVSGTAGVEAVVVPPQHHHGERLNTIVLGCLIEAIHHLPNLESFFWNGCSPPPSLEVVDALAESCPRLQDLALPYVPPFTYIQRQLAVYNFSAGYYHL